MNGVAVTRDAQRPSLSIEDSFALHFARLHAAAYRIAFRILGNDAESQDVAAEVLTRAFSRWAHLMDEPEPWVVKVAGNQAIDVLRRRKTVREHIPEPRGEAADASASVRRLDLQRVLLQLPKRQREVVVLRYLADQSEQAVATALGISTGSVKSHGARGLRTLRDALGDQQEAEDV